MSHERYDVASESVTNLDGSAVYSEPGTVETAGEFDPFDPKNYRTPQDRRLNPNVDSGSYLPQTIEARKPKKSWFFRVHASADYRVELPIYTDDVKRRQDNIYLFSPGLKVPAEIRDLVRDTLVAAAVTSEGIPFLYTLTVADNSWYDSGVEIIRLATEEWVRQTADSAGGFYTITRPIAELGEPHFPDIPFRTYLERAFNKRVISSLDDPLIKKLRGDR